MELMRKLRALNKERAEKAAKGIDKTKDLETLLAMFEDLKQKTIEAIQNVSPEGYKSAGRIGFLFDSWQVSDIAKAINAIKADEFAGPESYKQILSDAAIAYLKLVG